jgi:thiol-disulfide isomerase/thioredoxin
MARYSILFSLIGAAALILAGCDKIENPIVPAAAFEEELYGPAPTFESLPESDAIKRVLVEDFTAHQCGNCPAAAIIAEDLVANYEGQISAMAIHAGNLANTDEGYFDTDWTTEEGDVFWDQLNNQANPVGRINRNAGLGGSFPYTTWEARVEEEIAETVSVGLQYNYEWVPANRHLNLHLHGTFYNDVAGPIRVAWLLLESHIFDYQLDYSADPVEVADYEFNHVLRGSVHGAMGVGFGSAAEGASAGETASLSNTFEWNEAWVIENTTVLAVVSDANGYVLNVAEIHVD